MTDDLTTLSLDLRFRLLTLGFTAEEIDHLETLLPDDGMQTQIRYRTKGASYRIFVRQTARSFKAKVFGTGRLKRRIGTRDKGQYQPHIVIYELTPAMLKGDPSIEVTLDGAGVLERRYTDPWHWLRNRTEPLDLNLPHK
jgi:hypothetical protein